jgi:hypothetical protein
MSGWCAAGRSVSCWSADMHLLLLGHVLVSYFWGLCVMCMYSSCQGHGLQHNIIHQILLTTSAAEEMWWNKYKYSKVANTFFVYLSCLMYAMWGHNKWKKQYFIQTVLYSCIPICRHPFVGVLWWHTYMQYTHYTIIQCPSHALINFSSLLFSSILAKLSSRLYNTVVLKRQFHVNFSSDVFS